VQPRQKPAWGKGIAREQTIRLCGLCALTISDMRGAVTRSACQAGPWMGRHVQRRQRGCGHSNAGLQVLVTQLSLTIRTPLEPTGERPLWVDAVKKVVVKRVDRLPDLKTKVRQEHVTA